MLTSAAAHRRLSRAGLVAGLAFGAAVCALNVAAPALAVESRPATTTAATDPAARPDFSTGAVGQPAATEPGAPLAQQPAPPAPPAAAPAPAVATPAPVAPLAPIPAAVTALLADTSPASGLKLSTADREALTAFYASRQGEPFWIEHGKFSAKAEAAKTRVAAAADDALDPKDFKLPSAPVTDAPADIARAEAQMSAAALLYARKAWGGRVTPTSVSPLITAQPSPFDAQAALVSLASSSDVAATLDGFNPQHPQFLELRKLLASARSERKETVEHPKIAFGKLVQPGDDDPRVPALRQRLGLRGEPDDFYYDAALSDAVVDFQKKNKIGSSGLLNKQTIRALNGGAASPRDDAELIELNMERWRWMPRDLGSKHVFVDIPVFQLHIMQDGTSTYETRVIVGKPTNQTPIFSDEIDHIVVNPYWNVPASIALNEMQGSSLRGFEVVNSRGQKVTDFSWADVKANKVRIRQPPGERNALGHIKFMFPNKHSVYLHDTSSRKLFERDARALSHGCVRVDRPLEFADALSGDQGFSGSKLKSMIGGKERSLTLSTKIPVHLTYFTAWVGPDGRIEKRPDLYDVDMRLRAALRGEPVPALPQETPVVRVAKPKPKPAPVQEANAAQQVPAAQAPQRAAVGPANWLSRIFGPR